MKRTIAVLLAALLLLCACGKKTAAPAESAAPSTPVESATPEESAPPEASTDAPETPDAAGTISARFVDGEDTAADYTVVVDEYAQEILFTVSGTVNDVQFVQVEMNEAGDLLATDVIWEGGTLTDGATFKLITWIPDVAAHVALRYTVDGETTTLAVCQSGKDGSLILLEM